MHSQNCSCWQAAWFAQCSSPRQHQVATCSSEPGAIRTACMWHLLSAQTSWPGDASCGRSLGPWWRVMAAEAGSCCPCEHKRELHAYCKTSLCCQETKLKPLRKKPKSSSVIPTHWHVTSLLLVYCQSSFTSEKFPLMTSAWGGLQSCQGY